MIRGKSFMTWLKDLFTNPFIITPIISWFVAQVMKMFIHSYNNKRLTLSRMRGDGGMPSCHAATVSSLGFICLWAFGPKSFQFAISLILAIIVCHDAMGVRQEAGKHAEILNIMMEESDKSFDEYLPKGKLNEYIGHTPIQVFAGIGVGFVMAAIMYKIFF